MSLLFRRRSKPVRGAVRGYILVALLLALIPVWLWADAPAWWTARGVLNPTATADDYAAVNQGQLKNIAKQGYVEMKSKLPGGAGLALDALWANPVSSTDDYAAVNLGQLKNVAKPFYDRLHELNYAGQPLAAGQIYPWDGNQASADDYALANIGQVKNLFSFVLPDTAVDPDDTDGDGLPDAWEILHFGNLDQTADGDYDNDGFTNLQEYEAGSDPAVDYYGGTPPIIEVVSGNDQNYRPGEFLPKPLVIRVKNTAGTPLAGAPVVFTASPEEGLLSPTKDGTADLKLQIVVLTDAQGLAQAWLQCP